MCDLSRDLQVHQYLRAERYTSIWRVEMKGSNLARAPSSRFDILATLPTLEHLLERLRAK